MEKLKNSSFFILILTGLFALIFGSYAFTYSESGKNVQKDMFNMFLDEYRADTNESRADTDRLFGLIKDLKK